MTESSDAPREAWFATTFQHSPIAIAVTRLRDNILLDVNNAWLLLLGYGRDETVGRTALERGLWADPLERQRLLTILTASQRVMNVEAELCHKSGRKICALVSAEQTELGAEPCVLFQIIDITERKQTELALRASEEQYRALMKSLDSGVAMFDVAGTFLYLNDLAAAQMGGAPGDFVGKTMHELFPAQLADAQLRDILTAISEDRRLSIEVQSMIQGQPRWFRTTIQPIHDTAGRPHYALVNASDIHDLKQAQEALLELNRTLEERVRQRTAELARAGRAKDEFLATMSHELRTPLNAILGYSEIILEELRGPINTDQRSALRQIMASGQHLLALINDILDLSKVEAGRMELQIEMVTLSEICQASLLLVNEQALRKALRLELTICDQPVKIEVDPRRLQQMLVNLLANAVKFTPHGGRVQLEVVADAVAEQVHFIVQDTGIGIAPEDLDQLFQPFVQLDARLNRQHEGSGLGLALVRRLAELHGGGIMVVSELGRGSRFTITLPYCQPPQVGAQPGDASYSGERSA